MFTSVVLGLLLARDTESSGLVSVAIRNDGRTMAVGGWANSIEVVTFPDRLPLRFHKGHLGHITGLSYSSNGKYLVSGSSDGTIKVWSATEAKLTRTIKAGTSFVSGIAVSPDSRTIYSSGYDNLLKAWDLQTGKLLQTYRGLPSDAYNMAMAPNGKYIAGVGPSDGIAIWNAQTGKLVFRQKGGDVNNCGVTFSPDSKSLAVGSLNGSLRIMPVDGSGAKRFQGTSRQGSISALAWVTAENLVGVGYFEKIEKWGVSEEFLSPEPLGTVAGAMFQGIATSPDKKTVVAAGTLDETAFAVAIDPIGWSIQWIDSEVGCLF